MLLYNEWSTHRTRNTHHLLIKRIFKAAWLNCQHNVLWHGHATGAQSFRSLTGSPYIHVGIYFERKLRFLLAFSLTAIWSVLFSSLYDELCWCYLFQTQYSVSTMITFYTYRVVVAKFVRTVLQGTNRTWRPKWTASAFAVTKNFRTSVPIYYFALQKMRHKPASTKDLELCARSIPQLWGYKNYHTNSDN